MNIKKVLTVVILVLCIINTGAAYAASDLFVVFNGEAMPYSIAPEIIDGRTMVCAEDMLKKYDIPYQCNNNEIVISMSETENLTLSVGNDVMKYVKNGETSEIKLDSSAFIKDDKMIIPLRAVSEAIGYTVDWQNEAYYVSVKSEKIVNDDNHLEDYAKFLNKSKEEIKKDMKEFDVCAEDLLPFIMYGGTDAQGKEYIFGFMDGIDRCCFVETIIKNVFPGLAEIYEPYEYMEKSNVEKYIGAETTCKYDNFEGYYLEYTKDGNSVRLSCCESGGISAEGGLYLTQNEPAYLQWLEDNYTK